MREAEVGADAQERRHEGDAGAVRGDVLGAERRLEVAAQVDEEHVAREARCATASSIESTGMEPSRSPSRSGAGLDPVASTTTSAPARLDSSASTPMRTSTPRSTSSSSSHVTERKSSAAAPRPAHRAQAAAELRLALEERDLVTAPGGDLGRLQPRRAAADDDHSARDVRRLRLAPLLAAHIGVVEARDRQAADHPVDAALVGAHAVPDPAAVAHLGDEVGIGDQGPCHRDDVAVAAREGALRDGRVVDPARGDDRDPGADRVAQAVRERQELAQAVTVAADRAGVVPGAGALGLAHVVAARPCRRACSRGRAAPRRRDRPVRAT